MTFDDLPAGASVFIDANTLTYYFQPHPALGPVCARLVRSIEHRHLLGFPSTHMLGEDIGVTSGFGVSGPKTDVTPIFSIIRTAGAGRCKGKIVEVGRGTAAGRSPATRRGCGKSFGSA